MTRTRQLLRRALAATVALPLAGAALVATAPGAAADVRQPVDGSTFTSYRTVAIEADYDRSNVTERLFLTSPGGVEVEVASQQGGFNGGTLSYVLDLACWTKGCSGSQLAPNGTWTIRQGGGTSATSTFTTAIEPAAPTALRAEPLNPREVQISWRLGAEPDLVSWTVYEGSAPVQERIGRDSACAGSTCSTVIRYASPGSGDHSYTVKAHRATAPGSTSTLDSPMSAPASVRLENPPPSPAPAPDGDGSTGGSGGGSDPAPGSGGANNGGGTPAPGGGTTTGGSGSTGGDAPAPIGTGSPAGGESADAKAVAQRKAFALGFSAFGPKLGIPKLPPLPQAQTPAIAPELADGTFEPTLGFEDQVLTERVEVAQGPTQRVRNVVGSALDSERLATSTAAALVLLLAGAHLRRWLGAAPQEH